MVACACNPDAWEMVADTFLELEGQSVTLMSFGPKAFYLKCQTR